MGKQLIGSDEESPEKKMYATTSERRWEIRKLEKKKKLPCPPEKKNYKTRGGNEFPESRKKPSFPPPREWLPFSS